MSRVKIQTIAEPEIKLRRSSHARLARSLKRRQLDEELG
jgi:hypothetical protein